MTCDKCHNKPDMHSSGEKRLCCECYVKEGNPPADWHNECMKTYAEMPKKFEYHAKIIELGGKDRVAIPVSFLEKYHISDAEYKYFDIEDIIKIIQDFTSLANQTLKEENKDE